MFKYISKLKRSGYLALAAVFVLLNAGFLLLPKKAEAAALGDAYIRLDDMSDTTATGGTVCASASAGGAGTEATVKVTFPGNGTQGSASFGVSSTAGNWTVTTTNLPAGATAWPGIGTASSVSGAAVTFPSNNLTDTNLYCFNFSGSTTLTTPTSTGNDLAGSIITQATGPSTIDTGLLALSVIDDSSIDVTATVAPSFSFALSGTSDALSTLSTSQVTSSPTPRTVTITTNAANGFVAWIKSANAGLLSTAASDEIDTTGTVNDTCDSYSASSEYYGLDADESGDTGAGAIDAEYNCTYTNATTNTIGAFSSTYTELATGTTSTSGYVITLNNRAAASTTNKAATDYADTLTVTGAGNF